MVAPKHTFISSDEMFPAFFGQGDFGAWKLRGGARFEYGEQQGQATQTAFSKTLKKMSETGGEI
jgi:hypothetical protein